jgi:hypothetical protein
MPYYDHSDLSQLLHKEEFSGFNFQTLLEFGPPPKSLMDGYKNVIKAAPPPFIPLPSFSYLVTQSNSLSGC